MELSALARQVEAVAREAGRLIREAKHPEVYVKEGHANFVTSMDLASQTYIIEHLLPLLPQANFFAEERRDNELEPGYNWIIDPIDGTSNYMMGLKHSCISIGLVRDGEGVLGVVYDPFFDEMFVGVAGQGAALNGRPIHAVARPVETALVIFGTTPYDTDMADLTFDVLKEVFLACGDLRRTGSAALDMCYVACGRADAYFEMRIQPWDYAGAAVIAREAGVVMRGLRGGRIDFCNPVGMLAGGTTQVCDAIDGIVWEHARRLGLD